MSDRRPWIAIGAVLLGLAAAAFGMSFTRHATTAKERTWTATLARMGVDGATADALAEEVRRGAGPHPRTGAIAQDVSNLRDDVAHLGAIRRYHAIEDAQAAHAHRWRLRALPLAAAGVLVLGFARFGGRGARVSSDLAISNPAILAHRFLQPMFDDNYFPAPLVRKARQILLALCERIERDPPAAGAAARALADAATAQIDALGPEFVAERSDLTAGAREAIDADVAHILASYRLGGDQAG